MATALIQPVWNRVLNRFYNRLTGRIISGDVAASLLRSSGGAFRDVLGRHVPSRFLGGVVVRQFPTGKVNIAGLVRSVPERGGGIPIRSHDILSVRVRYYHPIEGWQYKDVSMPRGRGYDEDILADRVAGRLVRKDKGGTPELEYMPEIDWTQSEWRITSQYREGEYLGYDLRRFEG